MFYLCLRSLRICPLVFFIVIIIAHPPISLLFSLSGHSSQFSPLFRIHTHHCFLDFRCPNFEHPRHLPTSRDLYYSIITRLFQGIAPLPIPDIHQPYRGIVCMHGSLRHDGSCRISPCRRISSEVALQNHKLHRFCENHQSVAPTLASPRLVFMVFDTAIWLIPRAHLLIQATPSHLSH